MVTKQKRTKVVVSVLALAGLCVFSLFAVAGNLEPSAPPAPTMKTLDEVEPRIPISSVPCTISASGSYYLTGDLTSDGNGITIEANDVTIDLMGYNLIGPGSGINHGIYMNGRRNVEIRNGTVRNFGSYGVYERSRATGKAGEGHGAINVRAVSNGGCGIWLDGYGHLVKDCTAVENGGDGIYAHCDCTLTGNTTNENGGVGIFVDAGCTVTSNTARGNGDAGIKAKYWSTVTGNTAYWNGQSGIHAEGSCTVTGNTAGSNSGSGIYARRACMVTGNTVTGNNTSDSTFGGGIRVNDCCWVKGNTIVANFRYNVNVMYGTSNIIEENVVIGTGAPPQPPMGIHVEAGLMGSTGNLIIKNRARNHTTNYDISGGNTYGQILNPAGVPGFVNDDPTANFEF
jgi:parallel beta-helix repeat protein